MSTYYEVNFKTIFEEMKVRGTELVDKVRQVVQEGNVTRIIIKNEAGETIVEMPVTVAAAGAILAPLFAAISAIATVVTRCTIVIERKVPVNPDTSSKPSEPVVTPTQQ